MSKLVTAITQNETFTNNGAKTNSTTLDPVLDLFFLAGASRNLSEQEIVSKLSLAYNVNPELTTKLIFWAGDIRSGLGERRFFQICLRWLNNNHNHIVDKNLDNIPFYNRYDALFEIAHNNNFIVDYLYDKLTTGDTLLSKWMPRRKQYNNLQQLICKTKGISYKKYRKLITKHNNVVENKMCKKQWSDIKYETVPSVASSKYKKAFRKNDEARYDEYINSVLKGDKKMNAGAIFPHDIVYDYSKLASYDKDNIKNSTIAQWNNLPNLLKDDYSNILPVCDVSGSMYGFESFCKNAPINICIALGLYLSERNNGIFKDVIMTFSQNPKLQQLSGNVCDRIDQLRGADWGYNTNLQKVFDSLLRACLCHNLKQEDLPESIIIFSDMQFDIAVDSNRLSNFETINKKFEQHGYKRPKLIFWNLESSNTTNYPVQVGTDGTALVSGFSVNILKSLLGSDLTPESVMLRTLNSDRYDKVRI